jgi:prepilin-type N-terminal cleavage/methylation domain-containing protein
MLVKMDSKNSGFTLIELMVTLLVLAIIMSMAAPSMMSYFDRHRVIGAAEELYSVVQQARVEALGRSTSVYLVFSADGTGTWRYGMSQDEAGLDSSKVCDPSIADLTNDDACYLVVDDGDGTIDGVDGATDYDDRMLMVWDDQNHQDIQLTIVDGGTSEFLEITNMRGVVDNAWDDSPYELEFTSGDGKRLRIQVGILGQVRMCTPDDSVGGYSLC